ncbi:MAG: hypothetical protein A3E82_09435 [Gammaproteobacteria bacterium RIFCSPHIGHO2_12_FULL_38_11]|nr:MAG: hypothetical protein A3E82_09435 [Gammaproteobacteria bacterium RIFCSPHIGHO2_12_FULL_38_11]
MRDEGITDFQAVNNNVITKWKKRQNKIVRTTLDKTATFRKLNKECRIAAQKNTFIDAIWLSKNGLYQRILIDKKHPKGLWQEIKIESYCSKNPEWETLLDLDEYTKAEKKDWEFLTVHDEIFNKKIVSLITFSEAGSDAFFAREFDIKKKKFVSNGFSLPKANSDITWYSKKSLLLATECGENSLTTSNYPRTIRLLHRKQSLQKAQILFEVDPTHMMVSSIIWRNEKKQYLFFVDHIDYYHTFFYLVCEKELTRYYLLPIPTDAELLDVYQNTALIKINSNWQVDENTVFKKNTLIGLNLKKFKKNPRAQLSALDLQVWYEADTQSKIETIFCDINNVYLFILNNLCMQILHVIPSSNGIRTHNIPILEDYSYVTPLSIDNNQLLFYFETFTHPKYLYAYNPLDTSLTVLQRSSDYFPSSRYFVRRLEAQSKDGQKIPYHVVGKTGLKHDGLNPTILRGYGGFADYLNSTYLKSKSVALIEKGFLYVHAHIRGGGEFGPLWHKMGSQLYKQNSFDDFIAVAEDLINRKITSPEFLGITGESNGGLLVAACCTQRPELFAAVFCDVAILDMLHYHQFGVGRSWLAEYGNPDDPVSHQALAQYSPLHNITAEVNYPSLFFQSSKTDDRVHPHHSYSMVRALQKIKKPVIYFEKNNGGHTGISFEDCIRLYTYWHLRLLIPAQRKRNRDEYSDNDRLHFFHAASKNNAKKDNPNAPTAIQSGNVG